LKFDINKDCIVLQIINEKPQVIREYESGKAIPNQQIIGKLERALGAKLRGKK
jgi:putative transcription factor